MKELASNMEIISVHWPKTAGSTFKEILLQVYGADQVILDYKPKWHNVLNTPPEARVIHGHFSADKYSGYFSDAKRIIWLRHPILRAISLYYYWKSRPLHIKEKHPDVYKILFTDNLSCLEFIEERKKASKIDNLEKRIKGLRITDFYFVGIQEFFLEDLMEIKAMLSWPEIQVPNVNLNLHPNYQYLVLSILNEPATMNKLAEIFREDIEIYQTALNLRAKRRNEAGISHSMLLEKERSRLTLSLVQAKLERTRSRLREIKQSFNPHLL